MEEEEFYPMPLKKTRVQLSSIELMILSELVYNRVKNREAADPEVQTLGAILLKLKRAYNRTTT